MHESNNGVVAYTKTLVETAAVCEKGLIRETNDDSIAIVPPPVDDVTGKGTLFIVASGIGVGHTGEFSSAIITRELPRHYFGARGGNNIDNLIHAVDLVNTHVHWVLDHAEDGKALGSTAVAAVVSGNSVTIANVGDCRAYLLRDGGLRQLTRDHLSKPTGTGESEGLKKGDLIQDLTMTIGSHAEVIPHVSITTIKEEDLILLCSDGLTSIVSDDEIQAALFARPIAGALQTLVQMVRARGGKDNLSIILSRVTKVVMLQKTGFPKLPVS